MAKTFTIYPANVVGALPHFVATDVADEAEAFAQMVAATRWQPMHALTSEPAPEGYDPMDEFRFVEGEAEAA